MTGENNMNQYGVILAGGGGTRFWPLSRQHKPKQLLNLSGREIMINEAADRLLTVMNGDSVFVVTSEQQAPAMAEATRGRLAPENILVEPAARNTAACIAYAAMKLLKTRGDGIMVITPADHYIENVPALTELFRLAARAAEENDALITIGIKPTFPSTGYGYIRYEQDGAPVRRVRAFREKPDEKIAEEYLASGDYAWNSGMFIWRASYFLEVLKAYAPDIHGAIEEIGAAMGTPREQEVLHRVYPTIRSISVDYAVMEPCARDGRILMIPGDCGWSDVGSWDALNAFHRPDEDGNILLGDVTAAGVRNSIIYSSKRVVTALNVENLIIVETPDAIMVCDRDSVQDVKKLVERLEQGGRNEVL